MLIFWVYTPCNIGDINPQHPSSGQKTEEAGSSETMVNTSNITRRPPTHPQDQHLNHCSVVRT